MNGIIARRLDEELRSLQAAGRVGDLRQVEDGRLPRVKIDGRWVLVLCSNDYLGFAGDAEVCRAASDALQRFGHGNASGRSVVNTTVVHEALETALADLAGYEAALLFTSAYTANLGLLCTVVGPGDYVLSDRLNHASIIDGCRFSGAHVRVYEHMDLHDLRRKLVAVPKGAACAIVTDGVFSMEGEIAPLPGLLALAREFGALLIVDDAHAVGVIGATGGGTAQHFGLDDRPDVQVGTIGKALGGALGGYVAGSRALREALIHRARNFIFTNPVPASVAAGSLRALERLEAEPERLARLRGNAATLRAGLRRIGLTLIDGEAPIIPILIGDANLAFEFSRQLLDRGILVPAFGPPVVPAGRARLRVIASASHSEADLEEALEAVALVARHLGVAEASPT